MIIKPLDVLTNYEIRRSKRQKTAFITAVTAYATSQRYSAKVEKDRYGCRNIVIGDPEKADYLITAHYDTCAWMPFPNLVTPFCLPIYIFYQLLLVAAMVILVAAPGMLARALSANPLTSSLIGYLGYLVVLLLVLAGPSNRHTANDNTSGVVTLLEIMSTLPDHCRKKVCFVLFDLEEAGLLGSYAYRKAHKAATNRQIVLNMDCVGDGDEILLIPCKKLRNDQQMVEHLQSISGTWGNKSIRVHTNGLSVYPSDQMHFPNGIALAAFHKSRVIGCYLSRIHTHRDTVLDRTNVNILRAALISLITKT